MLKRTTVLLIAALTSLALVAQAQAAHGPLTGDIRITNDRFVPVTVAVDGAPMGRVAPKTTRLLRAIPNGVRVVTFAGPRGHEQAERVDVRINRRSDFLIAPRRGAALIKNRSGVAMRVVLDGQRLGVVQPGEKLETGPMRPGHYTLIARPLTGGVPVERDVTIRAGDIDRVKIPRYLAKVTITNALNRPARAFLAGRPLGRLRPGQSIVVDDVHPGRVSVSLKGRFRTISTATLNVAPGERSTWAPRYAAGIWRPEPVAQAWPTYR